jgi:bifunctional ADP-heptose synthase (sugar kinase/adenylyltransferase)
MSEVAGLEAIVIGRLHADLYPQQVGVPLEDVRTFERFVGGFAGNVGVGLARLGARTGVVSSVGDDGATAVSSGGSSRMKASKRAGSGRIRRLGHR